jgi:hypothetical protein
MRKLTISMLLVLIAVPINVFSAGAEGEIPLPPGVEAIVLNDSDASLLIAYSAAQQSDKASIERSFRQIELQERGLSSATTLGRAPARAPSSPYPGTIIRTKADLYYSASGTAPFNGLFVQTYYEKTHVFVNWADCGGWCTTAIIDGHTHTVWVGANPFYSDAIQLSEKWSFRGLAVSASVSLGGIGLGFSASGSEASFSSGWIDTAGWAYRLSNQYTGVRGKSYLSLWGVEDTATGSHRFGYQIVTATANGGISWVLH